jgi:calmodulin
MEYLRNIKIRNKINIPFADLNRLDCFPGASTGASEPKSARRSPAEYEDILSRLKKFTMATVMMKEGTQVPDEFLESFRENFDLVDQDKDGLITREQASLLFRGLGQTPTNSELNELINKLPQQVSFDSFIRWFGASYKHPVNQNDLTRAFRVFDLSNSGVLPVSKFRELLTNLGDHMSSEEIEEILKEIPVDSRGNFDYVVFARRLSEGPKGCPHLISKDN